MNKQHQQDESAVKTATPAAPLPTTETAAEPSAPEAPVSNRRLVEEAKRAERARERGGESL